MVSNYSCGWYQNGPGLKGFTDEELIEFTRHADTRTLKHFKGMATEDEKLRKLKDKFKHRCITL